MHRFANPAQFNRLADAILPWATGAFVLLLGAGLYYAFFDSPPDYQQGESVRVMYIHVPAAWMAMFTYMVMAVASFTALVWRHPLALLAGRAAAPIGAVFTALALITGMLWGKPMWGTYWVWDGRLTSVLVLLFLYLGYMALWQAIDEEEKAGRAASILALVGVVNIPIIKFSVDWWSTLHQPASVMRLDGPTIDGSMLMPLLLMAGAYQAYFAVVFLWRMKLEINRRKLAVARQVSMHAPVGAE
ncbi:MAG: heme ABC transporter permease [Kordiimonadaceae bacterium]|nr:heme ABC transporter permease [Kordiimonadaceae bacterium]MBO6568518.1 heme ABC transporter permease [Kordiimonadaceae bacterium]MBO6963753.1 heme ABC transporter permease [Kordiimonadaceae bacterium]